MPTTNPFFTIHRLTLATGALVVLSFPAFAQQDKVFQKGQDKPTAGTIEDETLSDIKIKIGAGSTTMSRDKIGRVEYGAGNAPFSKAEDNISKGEFAAAQAILDPLKPEREIFIPRRLYLLAQCFEGLGKPKDAEERYNELVLKFEKSYYTKLAIRSLVGVQIKNNNFAAAVTSADKGAQLAQAVKNSKLALEFRLIKGNVLEAQDKIGEAEAEYRAVAGAPDAEAVGKLAECGIARMAAKSGDIDKVKVIVDPILKGNDPVLLPAAYTAMGDALLNNAVKSNPPAVDKIHEAAVGNYLRVVVQVPPPAGESQDDLERSLFGYIKACRRLSELEKAKDAVEFWRGQVTQHSREFKEKFATSRFRKQVDELARFGG